MCGPPGCERQSLVRRSLWAGGSNRESLRGNSLDCFVARAPRNDGAIAAAHFPARSLLADTPSHPRGSSRPSFALSPYPLWNEGAGKAGSRLAPVDRHAKGRLRVLRH
ncbi:MAG: hypothetical protein EKK33_30270, partial [Bradyrhizobiaceae bacterium]